MQKITDMLYEVRLHFMCPDIFHSVEVVEDGAVHGDDWKAEMDACQNFMYGSRGLFSGDGKAHAFVQVAVQLDQREGGQLTILAEEHMVNAGDEEGGAVTDSGQVD